MPIPKNMKNNPAIIMTISGAKNTYGLFVIKLEVTLSNTKAVLRGFSQQ